MTLDHVRLYDAVPLEQSEGRVYFPPNGVTTSLVASDTCKLDRDELGWIHVRLGRKVEGGIEWRPKVILLGPGMVKFAEFFADTRLDVHAPGPTMTPSPTGELSSNELANARPDMNYRHPKAKKR